MWDLLNCYEVLISATTYIQKQQMPLCSFICSVETLNEIHMSPALPFVRLLPRLPLVSSLEEMRDALITREHGVGVAGGNTA